MTFVKQISPHSLDLRSITSPARASKGQGEGNPKPKLLGAGALLVLGLCALASARAQANVIYTYTGNPFTVDFTGSHPPNSPYTINDKITGEFSVATPLPANQALSSGAITPLSFSFNDGVQTITNLNDPTAVFDVGTNSSAMITSWIIQMSFNSNNNQIITQSYSGPTPLDEGADVAASGVREGDPGVWSMTTVPAPIVGAGIPGLVAGLGAFLFWRGRSAAAAFVRRRHRSYQPAAS